MATLKRKTNNGYEPLPAMVVRKTNAENGNGIGTCSTSSGTALAVTLSGYELVQNGFVAVTFSNDVPANATLNVNGKGAKPIIYKGSAIEADTINADDTVIFAYDGTNYVATSLGGGGGSQDVYEILEINVNQAGGSASDLIGATITVTNSDTSEVIATEVWDGTPIYVNIPIHANYTVSGSDITGYRKRTISKKAVLWEDSITYLYFVNGVYIEATDGDLYTSSTWPTGGKSPNAIVLFTTDHSIRISIKKFAIRNYGTAVAYQNVPKYATESAAKLDFDGEGNTELIWEVQKAGVVQNCVTYVFPNGKTNGYLPSLGETYLVYQNLSNINTCLSKCGGEQFPTDDGYYTSTLANNSGVWTIFLNNGNCEITTNLTGYSYYARPFASYE